MATVIAPLSTRAPPTPRTTRKATWIARPALVPATELQRAKLMPSSCAPFAAVPIRRSSTPSAPDALTVLNAPSARSSAPPIAPTERCAWRDARRSRGMTTPITAPSASTTPTIVNSRTTST